MNSRDVEVVLGAYPPSERPFAPPEPLGGAGGLSGSRLWRFRSPHGDRVLRAWPAETPGLDRVLRVHGWLRFASSLPFIPQPIAATDGSTAQGLFSRLWQLDPWLDGSPDLARPPAVERVRAAFRALAEFHQRLARIDGRRGPSPGLAARREEVQRLVASGFDALQARVRERLGDPCYELALGWLTTARRLAPSVMTALRGPLAALPLQPCLRDARPEHFLFAGEVVAGLIDFGAMDVETVGADLARLAGEWLPRGECDSLRAAGLASYREVRPLEPAEESAAASFESLADVLMGERWVRWRFVDDRRFDDDRVFARGIGRGLERAMRLAREIGVGA